MIRCPFCGTFNHDSQHVCRSCGSALPQTRRRCPECGALNPIGNLFCDRCNARLVETESIAPTPTSDNAQDTHAAVKGISLPTRAVAGEEDAGRRTELPDWLVGLVDEDTEFGLTEPTQEESVEAGSSSDLEDRGLPDWLGGGDVSTPVPLLDAAEAPLPDWLGGGVGATPASPLDAAEAQLPDWLSGGAEGVTSTSDDEADEDEWLSARLGDALGLDAAPEEAIPVAQEPETSPAGEAGLDWLSDESPAEVPESAIFSESELPDWLAQAQGLISTGTGDAAGSTAETLDEITAADLEPGESHDTAEDESLELPDWLQQIADEDSGPQQLPDWLVALSREQAPPSPEAAGGIPLSIEGESAPAPALVEGMPDRLAGLSAGKSQAVFEAEEPSPDIAEPAATDGPRWLSDLAPLETSAPPKPEVQVFVGQRAATESEVVAQPALPEGPGPVPDWLKALDLESSAAAPAAEPVPELTDLARAELPTWLQELAPPGALQGVAGEPAVVAPDTLAPADIPEWVAALRPEARAAGAPPPARAILSTPAEPEGPLEGLASVLASTTAVDIPTDAKLATVGGIPESIIAQAQLWQKLLEQPRSAERSVRHGRPKGRQRSGMFRWIVSAILVIGLFAAFWLIPEDLRIAQVSPTQVAPGVPAFVAGLDRLEPGDRVILAIEYGPAYADEMSQIATPILAHLSSRQVEVIVVSSLLEGTSLGNALSSLPSKVTGGGYLAGNASGIAAFLSQPDAATADHLVVLGSESQRLIWWLEQNALRGADALPVSIGTSAGVGPLIAPYLGTDHVEGWVTGFTQALAYRETRGDGDNGDLNRILDLLMIAHWAVVALLFVAFFYTLVDRKGAS